ncbi:MAG: hypothetical protein HRU36_03060 [Rickettsiales bacterium]|nr:hypothetical protein [Rickettsiales bacterium]
MRFLKIGFVSFLILNLSGCISPKYSQNWRESNPKGMVGASIEYADEKARQKIILSDFKLRSKERKKTKKSVLLNKRDENFEMQPIENRGF